MTQGLHAHGAPAYAIILLCYNSPDRYIHLDDNYFRDGHLHLHRRHCGFYRFTRRPFGRVDQTLLCPVDEKDRCDQYYAQ